MWTSICGGGGEEQTQFVNIKIVYFQCFHNATNYCAQFDYN